MVAKMINMLQSRVVKSKLQVILRMLSEYSKISYVFLKESQNFFVMRKLLQSEKEKGIILWLD